MEKKTVDEIIEELQNRIAGLEEKIAPDIREIVELKAQKERLVSLFNTTVRFGWTDMALDCLKKHNELLQTNEILAASLPAYQDENDERKKKAMNVGLSVALNNMCDNGTLRKVIIKGYKGHFYGLPHWFGEKALYGEYAAKLREKTKRNEYAPVILSEDFKVIEN